MYEAKQKKCLACLESKYLWEFQRKSTWVSVKCKECLKKMKKPSEREILSNRSLSQIGIWEKPAWRKPGC
jgi:hypothetical protein